MQKSSCPIAHHASLHPNKIAIEQDVRVLSYSQTETEVQRIQYYLIKLLKPCRIGIIAHSSIDTILVYFAALREGFSVCLISPKDPPQLVQEKIQELELSAIFTKAPSVNQIPSLAHTVTHIMEDSTITYLYTSGSSAKPKIACLSYANLTYSALGLLDILQLTSNSRYLLSLPLNHVSGLSILFRVFLSGATVVIPKHPYELSSVLIKACISHLSLVSTQYLHLLKTLNTLPQTLKNILLGGSSFSHSPLQEGIDRGIPICLSYGLTEMSSTVCCNPLLKTKDPSHTGYLLPYRKLKLNEDGEILVAGETLFQGYYDINTKTIVQQKGWFSTNDLGKFHASALKLHGRKDRLIISGGENIQPEEIELALLNIAEIKNALVLPFTHKTFGQQVVAIIDADKDLPHDLLTHYLEKTLPKYKIPKVYLPWPHHLKPEEMKISSSLKKELFAYLLIKYSL